MSAPELYVSECCGGVFVPGHGPDNLHEAEAGARLLLETEPEYHGSQEHFERVYYVDHAEEGLYDAVRAGDCPCCGEECPGLHLVADGDDLGGGRRE